MSPDYWTSHGCSALFVSVCIFVWYMYSQFCMSLCALPASLCISCANGLSFYFESMCLLALLFVCLFVFVSYCLYVSLCLYVCTFPPSSPLLKCLWCTWPVWPRLCVCVLFFYVSLCLFVCVYIFAYMLFPCGGGAHGRTGQGCGKVWGGDLSH